MKSRNTYQETDNDSDFWISYTDLITGFLIIFIIIALYLSQKNTIESNSVSDLKADYIRQENHYIHQIDSLRVLDSIKTKEYEVSKKQYEYIKQIDIALNLLTNSDLFKYNTICDRFELNTKIPILFPSHLSQPKISSDIPNNNKKELREAGKKLQEIIKRLERIENIGIKIIIEGRAAREERNQTDGGKELSYRRALSLYKLWFEDGKMQIGNNTEVFISGSGFEGKCRYKGAEEGKNKNFIVQIVHYLKKK